MAKPISRKNKDSKQKSIDSAITKALLQDFSWFEEFVLSHLKSIFIGAAVFVAAIVICYAVILHRSRTEERGATALANAETEAELTAALKEYPTNPAAAFARIRLANLYIAQKKYAEAREEFAAAAAAGKSELQVFRFRLDEAYLLEEAGQTAEAAAKFETFGRNGDFPEALRAEALYAAGRLNIATGDLAKATTLLQLAAGQNAPDSPACSLWANNASALLLTLPQAK